MIKNEEDQLKEILETIRLYKQKGIPISREIFRRSKNVIQPKSSTEIFDQEAHQKSVASKKITNSQILLELKQKRDTGRIVNKEVLQVPVADKPEISLAHVSSRSVISPVIVPPAQKSLRERVLVLHPKSLDIARAKAASHQPKQLVITERSVMASIATGNKTVVAADENLDDLKKLSESRSSVQVSNSVAHEKLRERVNAIRTLLRQ